MKVSLAGINAPEDYTTKGNQGQPYSECAKKYLAELVLNKVVDIKGYGLDRNDYVLGVIFLKGININIEMIRAGLAEVSDEELPRDFDLGPYRQTQKEAMRSERGMWSQVKR